MKFATYTHNIVNEGFSKTDKIHFGGILLLLIATTLYFLDNSVPPKNVLINFTAVLFFIGIIPIFFAYIYQFYDFENIKISDKVYLEIYEDEIIINRNSKILLKDITEFEILIDAYYNEKIYVGHNVPTERRSLGVSNKIMFVVNKKKFDLSFKLNNEAHKNNLENALFNIITNEKLKNLNARKCIKLIPEKFKKSKVYKDYELKQIVQNRISCTEGLLFHGYSSDKEAKLLREKFCT